MTSYPSSACGSDTERCACAPESLPEEVQRQLADALQFDFKDVDHAVDAAIENAEAHREHGDALSTPTRVNCCTGRGR